MRPEVLEAGFAALGLIAQGNSLEQLYRYVGLIAKWNAIHNLTAIRDPDRMLVEHVLDSVSILAHVCRDRVLDIGSGAGLPGLPLAMMRPDWRITLLDSSQKRCGFMRQAVIELGLSNVQIVCERAERFQAEEPYDTVVARAFASVQHFARLAAPQVTEAGVILAMKGQYPGEELAHLPPGIMLRSVLPLEVPGLKASRHLVVMTKS